MPARDPHEPGGALFTNDRRTNEKAPTMTGNLVIDPELLKHLISLAQKSQPLRIRLAAWTNTSGAGKKYLSLKPSPEQEPVREASHSRSAWNEPPDEDLPF